MIKDQTIGSARAESDDSVAGIGADAAVAGRLGNGAFAGATSGENRRRPAFAVNPVSRLDALDELEGIGADAEDRYAHVPERHAPGRPEIASGPDFADVELIVALISSADSDSRSTLLRVVEKLSCAAF